MPGPAGPQSRSAGYVWVAESNQPPAVVHASDLGPPSAPVFLRQCFHIPLRDGAPCSGSADGVGVAFGQLVQSVDTRPTPASSYQTTTPRPPRATSSRFSSRGTPTSGLSRSPPTNLAKRCANNRLWCELRAAR